MKKNFFNIMLAFAVVVSPGIVAVQAHAASENEEEGNNATKPVTTEPVNELNGNMYEYDELVTTYGWPWTAITKTITKNYNSPDVPAAVHYTEYIDGKWYGGTLNITGGVVKLGPNIWQATYTGKINY